MAENEELRPEPQPAPTHYPEEKKEEKTLEEQMEEIKSWNLDTSHERPPIDAEPVQKTVSPEIEMLATPFKLWSAFCDHEVESMEAIGGFITDQAEEVAYDDDDSDSFWKGIQRDFCKGIIRDDHVTPVSLLGAAIAGGGKFIGHGWEGIWTIVGHPYKTTASAGLGLGYAATHGKEVIEGIEESFEEFENMNLNEKLAVGVETVCDVVLAYKSAKELVNVAKGARKAKNAKKLKAAGALETGGVEGAETTGIAVEAGEAGGIVGSEGGVAVEGAAGEAAEEIEGVAGKGKIRIESAGESGKYSHTQNLDGLDKLRKHLTDDVDGLDFEPNKAMMNKIEEMLSDNQKLTGAYKDFYEHELTESMLMKQGQGYNAAHNMALKIHGVQPQALYSPEIIQDYPKWFNKSDYEYWGIKK